jgi:hypothetical protein
MQRSRITSAGMNGAAASGILPSGCGPMIRLQMSDVVHGIIFSRNNSQQSPPIDWQLPI